VKLVNDSMVYQYMLKDKESVLNTYRLELLKGGMINLNTEFAQQLANIKKIYTDVLTTKAVDAVINGSVILFAARNPKHCMPSFMPFIKYKNGDKQFVAVDLTKWVILKPIKGSDEQFDVTMDIKKLYCFIITAYLYQSKFDRDTQISSKLAKSSAIVWAKLFCKVLEMKVGLATNRDRHDAFMYFAMMFFLVNIIEYNKESAENLAKSFFRSNTVSPTVRYIETSVENRSIDMYQSFEVFCNTLFDPDITGLRSLRLKGTNNVINVEYYVSQYITLYHMTSAFSLAAYPYFIWMVISSCNWAYLFNDKTIESIASEEYGNIMTELYRMV
jgi:hypothetical protein